ncbi:MAG: hypothetical protein RIG63_17815 [Coleofasciculus chthonoplastes F3-SA18-01]|uniref:hypothetical protein n=1 Tax=Coleofasciculus chthonoplastes TaxID=64178 RepID=UPI0032F1F437
MKSVLAESVVEQTTLDWLETLNYTPLNASEIAPDSLPIPSRLPPGSLPLIRGGLGWG